jgi:hypothetical protein
MSNRVCDLLGIESVFDDVPLVLGSLLTGCALQLLLAHLWLHPYAVFSHVGAQTCAWPPSAKSSTPVTKLESSDARNSATLAISSGFATRPRGTCDATRLSRPCCPI